VETEPIQRRDVVTTYLALMDRQREALFAELERIDERLIWRRPEPGEWSIGENLDHLRVFYRSMLPLMKIAWLLEKPIAHRRLAQPYRTKIDNVYKRPGFPLNVGWIWAPKHTPEKAVPLAVLKWNLVETHRQIYKFWTGKDLDLLGHVSVWDPAMGRLNLILALRVGLYHDELHFETIRTTLERFRVSSKIH
jgi:hypothetical protein